MSIAKTVTVEYDKSCDEYILPLGTDVCDAVGWQVGDTICWQDNGDGSYTLTKKQNDNQVERQQDPA